MKQSPHEHVHKLMLAAKELGLTNSFHLRRFFRILRNEPGHPVALQQAQRLITRERYQRELLGDPFDPAPRQLPGKIRIGSAKHCRAAWQSKFLSGNVLGLGGSGCGKSNLQLLLTPQLAALGLTVWTFELSKGEQKRSYHLFNRLGCPLVVIPAKDWVVNLLEVPFSIRIETWIVRIVEILTEALHIPDAAQDLLTQSLIELYRVHNVFNGSRDYPTLDELIRHIENNSNTNQQAKQALLRRLSLLMLELPRNMAEYHCGYDISDLSRNHLHFDLHGASERVQSVIVLHLVASLFEYRNHLDTPNSSVQNIVCLEESQRFLSGSSNLYISYLFSQVRGVGISIIGFVQTSGISDQVVANTSIKLLGRANLATDYQSFGACLGLTREQVAWAKINIRPGLFICKLSDGSFLRPFLVHVPLLRRLPTLSEHEIRNSQAVLDHSSLVATQASVRPPSSLLLTASLQKEKPSHEEQKFLQAVATKPGIPSSEFARILGISSSKSILLRKRLRQQGWITEHVLDSGGRGGRRIVLELTDEGLQVLEQ